MDDIESHHRFAVIDDPDDVLSVLERVVVPFRRLFMFRFPYTRFQVDQCLLQLSDALFPTICQLLIEPSRPSTSLDAALPRRGVTLGAIFRSLGTGRSVGGIVRPV